MIKLLIVLLTLAAIGCSKYPEPEVGTYNITIKIAEDAEAVKASCKNNSFNACAYAALDPCVVVLNKEDWELIAVHELAHCFNINNHGVY